MTISNPEELDRTACPAVALDMWQARATRGTTPTMYFRWKGIVDRAMAAVLLLPGLIIIGTLVLLVRLTSRGPGIFVQTRVGKDARHFRMYKIRTMTNDAERGTGPIWAKDCDPRTTRIGAILRRFHLDEFPQLINVLKGEMSLVGPRPERPEFVRVLTRQVPGYRDRLSVPPGITGLAQLNLPPDSDLDSVRQKLEVDLDYIHSAGLGLDLRILLCTFARLLKLPEGVALRLLGLRRSPAPPGASTPGTGESGVSDYASLDVETVAGETLTYSCNGDLEVGGGDGEAIPTDAPSIGVRKPR